MLMNRPLCVLVLAVAHFVLAPLPVHAQEVESLLTRIKAVGREGTGNVEAAKAWKELVKAGPSVLPQVLAGLNDADPTAANWIRAAAEVIAEQAITSGKGLQADKLEAFVKDAKNAGAARRLAFEQLSRVDPSAPDRLLPGMVNDPGYVPESRKTAPVGFTVLSRWLNAVYVSLTLVPSKSAVCIRRKCPRPSKSL